MKYILAFILIGFTSLAVFSQTQFFVGGSLNYGIPTNSFTGGGQYLRGLAGSSYAGADLSAYIRFKHRIGLIAGIGQKMQYIHLRDHDFNDRHPGFISDIENYSYYYHLFSQLQFTQSISTYGRTYIYLNTGFDFNMTGTGSISDQQFFNLASEQVDVKTTYLSNNIALTGEIGLQHFFSDKFLMTGGINTSISNKPLSKMDYTVTDTSTNTVVTTDQMTSFGNFIGFKVSAFYKFGEIEAKPKKLKPHPEVPLPPVVAQDTVKKDTVAGTLKGRDMVVTHRVEVQSNKVTIKIWDHQIVDGDIVSLNLNGQWLIENYTLEKKQYILQVELKDGDNLFVLHALNLGKYSPNTAAIIIDDGITQSKVILESNLQQSGTIDIVFNPKK
ncbi:MAG: hypothetical protein U0U66_00865 [Cytophagaceae bacterium]